MALQTTTTTFFAFYSLLHTIPLASPCIRIILLLLYMLKSEHLHSYHRSSTTFLIWHPLLPACPTHPLLQRTEALTTRHAVPSKKHHHGNIFLASQRVQYGDYNARETTNSNPPWQSNLVYCDIGRNAQKHANKNNSHSFCTTSHANKRSALALVFESRLSASNSSIVQPGEETERKGPTTRTDHLVPHRLSLRHIF